MFKDGSINDKAKICAQLHKTITVIVCCAQTMLPHDRESTIVVSDFSIQIAFKDLDLHVVPCSGWLITTRKSRPCC
jgi:hypothetical protein